MESRLKNTRAAEADTEKDLCGMEALRAALRDWQAAEIRFEYAEEPLFTELAAIRMQESGRRYGCLAARYKG